MIDSQAQGSAKLSSPFRNIFRLATGDLVAKATSFFTFVYLARILGVANFGVLEFAGSVLAYLLLISDGGLEMWGTREAANSADISALAARVMPLRLLLASLSFVILLALLPLFPHYPSLRALLVIYGLTVFAQAINLKWAFMGQQKMSGVAGGLVLGQALFVATVLVFVHNPAAVVWVAVFKLLSDLATAVYFATWFLHAYGRFALNLSLPGNQRGSEAGSNHWLFAGHGTLELQLRLSAAGLSARAQHCRLVQCRVQDTFGWHEPRDCLLRRAFSCTLAPIR